MTTKADLIEQVADQTGLTKAATGRVFEALTDAITRSLRKGEAVSITGVGTLSVKYRNARKARNPRTGDAVEVDSSKSARFSVSSNLKKSLNSR
jgi:DNA-binding protein HU-beta